MLRLVRRNPRRNPSEDENLLFIAISAISLVVFVRTMGKGYSI